MTEFEAAELVRATLIEKGYKAFLVGGCVRDLLIQREPNDWDVTTDATPDEVEGCFTHTVPVGKAFGVVIVLVSNSTAVDFQIEVATFRTDGQYSDGRRPDSVTYSKEAREDVIRRDFTINGMLCTGVADPTTVASYEAALAEPNTTRFGIGGVVYGVVDYVGEIADLIVSSSAASATRWIASGTTPCACFGRFVLPPSWGLRSSIRHRKRLRCCPQPSQK